MRQNILEYKGYIAKVEYSVEDQVLYGRIEGINDFVNFECEDVKKVQEAFQEAVDDYLQKYVTLDDDIVKQIDEFVDNEEMTNEQKSTYKKILKDGNKVQVESAIRDGDGVKISTNYEKLSNKVTSISSLSTGALSASIALVTSSR